MLDRRNYGGLVGGRRAAAAKWKVKDDHTRADVANNDGEDASISQSRDREMNGKYPDKAGSERDGSGIILVRGDEDEPYYKPAARELDEDKTVLVELCRRTIELSGWWMAGSALTTVMSKEYPLKTNQVRGSLGGKGWIGKLLLGDESGIVPVQLADSGEPCYGLAAEAMDWKAIAPGSRRLAGECLRLSVRWLSGAPLWRVLAGLLIGISSRG